MPLWDTSLYNDSRWPAAQVLGPLGQTPPWDRQPEVPVEEVVAAVRGRVPRTNVIITGRDAHPALIEIADTVTEMRKVKHAFDSGIDARRGIEY